MDQLNIRTCTAQNCSQTLILVKFVNNFEQWILNTEVWENFGVKKKSDVQWCPKIKVSKYFLQ